MFVDVNLSIFALDRTLLPLFFFFSLSSGQTSWRRPPPRIKFWQRVRSGRDRDRGDVQTSTFLPKSERAADEATVFGSRRFGEEDVGDDRKVRRKRHLSPLRPPDRRRRSSSRTPNRKVAVSLSFSIALSCLFPFLPNGNGES